MYLSLACRALLIAVFAVAVIGKLRSREAYGEFGASIAALRVLPRRMSAATAAVIVAAEVAAVALLALPATVTAGFAVAGGVLVAFAAGIVTARRRGHAPPCRCFGGASAVPLGPVHVARNMMLAAVAGAGLLAASPAPAPWPSQPGGVAVALTVAGVGTLIAVRIDDLVSLFTTTTPSDAKRGSGS